MDKNAIIAKCAQEPEDRLLLARVWDKYEQTERKNIPGATVFHDPFQAVFGNFLHKTVV